CLMRSGPLERHRSANSSSSFLVDCRCSQLGDRTTSSIDEWEIAARTPASISLSASRCRVSRQRLMFEAPSSLSRKDRLSYKEVTKPFASDKPGGSRSSSRAYEIKIWISDMTKSRSGESVPDPRQQAPRLPRSMLSAQMTIVAPLLCRQHPAHAIGTGGEI